MNDKETKPSALVLGASGMQGKSVISGICSSYSPVYGATRWTDPLHSTSQTIKSLGAIPIYVNLNDYKSIIQALIRSKAQYIFLVSTMEITSSKGKDTAGGLKEMEDLEFESIKLFFDALVDVYNKDGMSRTVVFSMFENVYQWNHPEIIKPNDDSSVVPHFSGKGRGGEYGLNLLKHYEPLKICTLTLPFLHESMIASAIPLSDNNHWSINLPLSNSEIYMLSLSDLAHIVPNIWKHIDKYDGQNLRLAAEKVSMNSVATAFSKTFHKNVIYQPLLLHQLTDLGDEFAAMAQMCQFFSLNNPPHDIDLTASLTYPHRPKTFEEWLVEHKYHNAFQTVGLLDDDTRTVEPQEQAQVNTFAPSQLKRQLSNIDKFKEWIEESCEYVTFRETIGLR